MDSGRDREIEREYQGVSPEEKPWGGDTVIRRVYGQTFRVRVRGQK